MKTEGRVGETAVDPASSTDGRSALGDLILCISSSCDIEVAITLTPKGCGEDLMRSSCKELKWHVLSKQWMLAPIMVI